MGSIITYLQMTAQYPLFFLLREIVTEMTKIKPLTQLTDFLHSQIGTGLENLTYVTKCYIPLPQDQNWMIFTTKNKIYYINPCTSNL